VAAEADGSTAAVPDEAASPAAELATQSVDPPATDAEPAPPAAAALENPAEDTIAPQIQEVEAQTAELTSASEPDMAAGTEPATAFADQAPVDALTAPDLSATDAELELESPDAEGNQAEDSISPQIQEVEAQTAELTSASEPDPADSTEPTSLSADQAPAAPSAEAAPDELSQAGPARTAPEAAPESAAPSAPAMEPDGLAADPETRLRIVDLTYVAPWLPGSGLQPAAAALQAVDAFLPGMHMRAAMPGIATAPAGEVLRATAVTLEIMAAAPAPARSAIVIDLDEAGWAALGPPEPDRPPPSRAAPQPEAAEDIPAWQSELPSPADAAELRAAPAASPPEPAATAPAQAAPAQAAVAPVPRPPASDPLAALKVMSAEELIALFS
jgi:hypothetical protein